MTIEEGRYGFYVISGDRAYPFETLESAKIAYDKMTQDYAAWSGVFGSIDKGEMS